jgi:hypothetical protein
MHQHDHRRIGTREMVGVAGGAFHHVAGRFRLASTTADAAEPVLYPPVHHAPRVRGDRRVAVTQRAADAAQIGKFRDFVGQQGQWVVDMAHVDREDRAAVQDAQEGPRAAGHMQRLGRTGGDEDGFRLALLHPAHQGPRPPDRDIERVWMA